MKLVKKKSGKIIKAYRLGDNHDILKELMNQGLLKKVNERYWRVFSQEATEGELAESGDYIKVDSSGRPYPNTRKFFDENHKLIGGDDYEQIPQALKAWDVNEPDCTEIQFLIEHKGLVIDKENEAAYFKAPLWGDILTAAKNAVIVFYSIQYDDENNVTDADFNFVGSDEFVKTYDVIENATAINYLEKSTE